MRVFKFLRNQSGVISIEFALIGPILCLLMVGLVDTGEALMRYRTVTQMTESTVRVAGYLSNGATSDATASIDAGAVAIMKNGIDLINASNPVNNINLSVYIISKSVISGDVTTDSFIITGAPLANGSFASESAALKPGETIISCQAEYEQPVLFDLFLKPFKIATRYSK